MSASAPFDHHAAREGDVRAPNLFLLMLEWRAPWEYGALLAALPWLRRAPPGDGHPVLVFPGLGANDITTVPMRRVLDALGYVTYPWRQGFNFGPRHGVLDRCRDQVAQIADRHGAPVSLVGWSLGGIYAREMAKALPDRTRCVVTLGTPFSGPPRATNAWRLYEMVSGNAADDVRTNEQVRRPPPVPTTSIYSRSDGIVAWRCSINPNAPRLENIEVQASHVGMGLHPAALWALADRLAQPHGAWQPFVAPRGLGWAFDTTHPDER